jgi:hypothetical protein
MKRILLSIVAVLALNNAYAQVKATSAELNTGTDDAKFATALALQGSKYLDQSGAKLYAVTAAGANVYTASIAPAITAYAEGQVFYIKITTANTGASALNLNGLGYKTLVKDGSLALVSGDLLAGKVYPVYYDGTNFQVLNAVSTVSNLTLSGNGIVGGNFGVGSGGTFPHIGIYNSRNLTGAGSGMAYGIANTGAVQSDVTTIATYNQVLGSTAPGSYTLPLLVYNSASQSTFGAGSAVTTQVGYSAESTLIGATNNYGFYGAIPFGTNRFNFYANGTALNYFNGDSGFGTNAPGAKVQVSTGNDAKKGLIIKGNSAAQSANVFEVQNSAGAQQLAVGPTGSVALGGIAINPSVGFYNTRGIAGSTTAYGSLLASVVGSDVTVQGYGFSTYLGTQAATFTLPNLNHFTAQQGVMGAGSTITMQTGFLVPTTLTGAATNYGFRGSIPSGGGRYNLFMDGTAQNYLAGPTSVGTGSMLSGQLAVKSATDAIKGVVIQGFSATQSANLLEVQNSAGTAVAQINPAGNVSAAGLALTTAPVTSAGGYDVLTRNTTTGLVEKMTSTSLGSNLSLGTLTALTVPVNISSGTGISLPVATASLAGLLRATDKVIIDDLDNRFIGNGSARGGTLLSESGLDANAAFTKTGFSYLVSGTNLGNGGNGAVMNLAAASGTGFQMQFSSASEDNVWFRKKLTNTFGSWFQVASRSWTDAGFLGNGSSRGGVLPNETGTDVDAISRSGSIYTVSGGLNFPAGTLGTTMTNISTNSGSQIFTSATIADSQWYRQRASGVWGAWNQVASRSWVNTQIQSISSIGANKLLGRYSAGSGTAQDVTLGSGLVLTSAGTLHSGYEGGGAGPKILKVSNPAGGQFKGAVSITGAIKIKLPSNAAAMYTIKGTLFQYDGTNINNRSTTFSITAYGSAMANGFSATFMGNNTPNYPVRWYMDGAEPAVYIGDITNTWSYVAVSIDEVQASYTGANIDLASAGWAVTMETAFTGTLNATQLNTLPFSNLSQPIAGFTAGADNALSQSDSQIGAFGKIQGQLNAIRAVTGTAAAANLVYAGPVTGTAAPTLRRLQRSDLTNGFGANGVTGTLDWNDVTNTQPGFGPTLLTGTATNGPGGTTYYHPFTIEYSTGKNGTGNITQMAYPYNPAASDGIQYRTRYTSTYTAWRKIWDSSNFTNLNQLTTRNFSDVQGKPTTLTGYGITDGATSASVTTVQNNVTALNGDVIHRLNNLTEAITGRKVFNTGVAIALTNPNNTTILDTYKLAVGGGIIAESVKVKPQGEWPDYVFEKGYPMLSLGDLEKYILKNKHLPDVPAAAEVKKEGLDLGEMNTKLLQKIEELTLYLIEKDKEIKKLAETVGKLNEDIKTIKNN